MDARVLQQFFEDRESASILAGDLRSAFERTSLDSYRLRMTDLKADFAVRSEHLVKLCDAVLRGELDPEALRAVGFGMIASEHFDWDADTPDGKIVGKTLYDWASPEVNYRLSLATVKKFRHRLLTGEEIFTRADYFDGPRHRQDEWTPSN